MSRRQQYLEALGIDVWVPRRALATGPVPATMPAAITVATPARAPAPIPEAVPAIAIATVSTGASEQETWQRLREEVRSCTRCGLCKTRTQTVFGVGEQRAELMIIGEAPGQDEDAQGEPFVGRAGQLLNSMLRAMGNPRETVYIANMLKCRPPNNRNPSPAEVASCGSYLERQIALIQPKLIVAVGGIAAQNLLATDTPVGRLRGQVHRLGERATPLIVTYHPAYLLRSPGEKRKVWTDLKFARSELARLRAV